MVTYWLKGEKNTPSTSSFEVGGEIAHAASVSLEAESRQILSSPKPNTPSIVREMVSTPSLEDAKFEAMPSATPTSNVINGGLENNGKNESSSLKKNNEDMETTPLLVSAPPPAGNGSTHAV